MKKINFLKTVAVAGFFAVATSANAQNAGELDLSFDVGTGANNAISAIAVQTDGKILIGGVQFTIYNGTHINRIARLNTNGNLDNTFDVGTGFDNLVNVIDIQPDGKVIVGGLFTQYNGTVDKDSGSKVRQRLPISISYSHNYIIIE